MNKVFDIHRHALNIVFADRRISFSPYSDQLASYRTLAYVY